MVAVADTHRVRMHLQLIELLQSGAVDLRWIHCRDKLLVRRQGGLNRRHAVALLYSLFVVQQLEVRERLRCCTPGRTRLGLTCVLQLLVLLL